MFACRRIAVIFKWCDNVFKVLVKTDDCLIAGTDKHGGTQSAFQFSSLVFHIKGWQIARLLIFAVSYVALNLSTEASRFSKSIFSLITNKSAEKHHSNDASFKILMVQPLLFVLLLVSILDNLGNWVTANTHFHYFCGAFATTVLLLHDCYIKVKVRAAYTQLSFRPFLPK